MPIPERRRLSAFLVFLVLALALGTIYLRSNKEEHTGPLPPLPKWQLDSSEISKQNELDEGRRAGLELRAGDNVLLKALSQFHRIEIETQADARMEAYRSETNDYRLKAERYVRDYGRERYAQLGLEARSRFLRALVTLREQADDGDRTLAGQVAHAPDRDELLVIRELGGGFLDFAVQRGLISEHGDMDEAHYFLIGVLFKVRWHRWVQNIDPVNANLTRRERRTLLRYQVSVPPVMTFNRRIRKLKDLASIDPSYPYAMAYAVLLIRAGRIDEAKLVVNQAMVAAPKDPDLIRIRDFLGSVVLEYNSKGTP